MRTAVTTLAITLVLGVCVWLTTKQAHRSSNDGQDCKMQQGPFSRAAGRLYFKCLAGIWNVRSFPPPSSKNKGGRSRVIPGGLHNTVANRIMLAWKSLSCTRCSNTPKHQ